MLSIKHVQDDQYDFTLQPNEHFPIAKLNATLSKTLQDLIDKNSVTSYQLIMYRRVNKSSITTIKLVSDNPNIIDAIMMGFEENLKKQGSLEVSPASSHNSEVSPFILNHDAEYISPPPSPKFSPQDSPLPSSLESLDLSPAVQYENNISGNNNPPHLDLPMSLYNYAKFFPGHFHKMYNCSVIFSDPALLLSGRSMKDESMRYATMKIVPHTSLLSFFPNISTKLLSQHQQIIAATSAEQQIQPIEEIVEPAAVDVLTKTSMKKLSQ